jgi:arylformamidase
MRLYDITPLVSPALAVWPGDTPCARRVLLDLARGDTVTLSTLEATVHLGAHADAESHYDDGGRTIERHALEPYLGSCCVLRVDVERGARIAEAVAERVTARRVLFSTGTFPDSQRFNEDFAALSVGLVDALGERGVLLAGVDTPSVDLFASKDLAAHRACLRHGIAILEGLVLAGVPEGDYELIALPLKLAGFDASPVRAILRG